MSLAPGTRLGTYELLALIGVGAMGEVYRAADTRLKRHVAIKVLPAGVGADPERLARVEREAQVLASLNHPHIPSAHLAAISPPETTLEHSSCSAHGNSVGARVDNARSSPSSAGEQERAQVRPLGRSVPLPGVPVPMS